MNEKTAMLATVQAVRDIHRKLMQLDTECDHSLLSMPIIDGQLDYQCSYCWGILSLTPDRSQVSCSCGWYFKFASWDPGVKGLDAMYMAFLHSRHLPITDCEHSLGMIINQVQVGTEVFCVICNQDLV